MILKTLPISFGMAMRILKEHKSVHIRVKGSSSSSTKKKNNNIKQGKFKKRVREQAYGQ